MTQEDKNLLYKDLCARLSYGIKVKIKYYDDVWKLLAIYTNGTTYVTKDIDHSIETYFEDCKPYLFPFSSMNEEQKIELFDLFGISLLDSIGKDYIKINECTGITFFLNKGFDVETHLDKLVDWLNAHHFDYRGLIEKGLAINATNLNIY